MKPCSRNANLLFPGRYFCPLHHSSLTLSQKPGSDGSDGSGGELPAPTRAWLGAWGSRDLAYFVRVTSRGRLALLPACCEGKGGGKNDTHSFCLNNYELPFTKMRRYWPQQISEQDGGRGVKNSLLYSVSERGSLAAQEETL